jgi:hypothetical protein
MRRRRTGLWIGGALSFGLVAGVAALWLARAALVESVALRVLAARGVPASLRVARVDLGGLELADLALGAAAEPDLRVAHATLAWSWRGLRERRLDRAELRGVRLRARLGEAGLELGALDGLRGGAAAGAGPPGLPFAGASFRDVEATVESARGPFVLRGEGEASTTRAELAGAAELSATTPFGSGTASLRLVGTRDAPRVDFSGQVAPDPTALGLRVSGPVAIKGTASWDGAGALGAKAKAALAEAELPELAKLTGVAVDAELAGDALTAQARVARLVELSTPARVAPLALEAQLTGSFEQLAFRGEARTGADGFTFSFDGTLEPRALRATLAVHLPDTDLAPAARQPERLFPWLADLVRRAKGHVAAEAEASYADGQLAARVQVAFDDVDLRTEYATLRRVNGVVTLTGPEPLATPPGQTVSVALIEGALPLSDGVLRFELQPGEILHVEQGTFRLAGGTLSLTASLPLEADERDLVLTARQLSVEQLLAALGFEGLSGTGFLDGTLPIEQRGRQMRVRGGELYATGPGVIRYAGGEGAAALAAKQPQLGTVLGALEDLRYETLVLEVSGDVSGQMDVKVHARGSNPNFEQGRPVVLNVNVEAPVQSLLRAGLAAYRVPEEIEGQVQRFFDRGKR